MTMASPTTPTGLLALIKGQSIQMVDVRFTGMPGTWQHFSLLAASPSDPMTSRKSTYDRV